MRESERPRRRATIFAALAVAFVSFAPAGHAIDEPHGTVFLTDPCGQCHDGHGSTGFFLINNQYINDLCLSCHDGSQATEVTTHLNPTKGPWLGRDFDGNGADIVCIDCHDPHSQRSALGQNSLGYRRSSDGANILRSTPADVARQILYDSTDQRASFIKDNPDNGICEVCHSATDDGGSPLFRFGDDGDTHYGQAAAQACTACHDHGTGFTPTGGDCVGCHNSEQGSAPLRRQITETQVCTGDGTTTCTTDADCSVVGGTCGLGGEFGLTFTSHHVNDGTGREIATKWDCVVCHAEGNVLTGETDATYHLNDGGAAGVQVKNVDDGTVFVDGGSVPLDWRDLTAQQRSEFCLSCHDTDGATLVASRTDPDPDATAEPLDPFNDGVTNSHEEDGTYGSCRDGTECTTNGNCTGIGDGTCSDFLKPHSRGRCSVTGTIPCAADAACPATETCEFSKVLDVASQFATANVSHHAVLDQAYTSPFGNEVDDSLQGFYPTGRTDLDWTSTIECEDCHYGPATTQLSAHGTQNARYMLRDEAGNDTLGAGNTILCFRCHLEGIEAYERLGKDDPRASDDISVFPEHDKSAHIDDSLTLFGISCLGCHAGGEYGGIHGYNIPVVDDDSGQSYDPNVFTYGSGLDWISNWTNTVGTAVTCSARGDRSLLNLCTQHGSQSYDRGFSRPYRDTTPPP
jgi:predicted CXXCH cytochrome family protein